ncbi:MAG: FG-GAP repeat domain-containing protein, partial [Pirellulales bacterium]
MPRSPTESTARKKQKEYETAEDQLSLLIAAGFSFSGHERGCAYLNTGGGRFANVSAVTGFDVADDGRAIALVDWDHDGDLDVWLANRTGPRLRMLRNDMPNTPHFVAIKLEGRQANRDAIGARVELKVGGEPPTTLIKTLHAGDGFLSQSSKWLH